MNIFASLYADGTPYEIPAGQPFKTYHVVVVDEQEVAWSGVEIGSPAPMEVSHPWTALDTYTLADLARYCIQTVAVGSAPEGEALESLALAQGGGTISATPVFVPIPAPRMLSRMQLKRALNQMDLLANINAVIASSGDVDLQIYWADAAEFHRDHPKIASIVQVMGYSEAQVDQAFTLAGMLS